MDTEIIKGRLTKEFGYPPKGAELVAHQLLQLNPRLYDEFTIWWQNGIVPEIEIEGYTLKRLMNEHSMNPIASFLTLDWLLRDPEKAKASLEKGHDHVR
jgi:hypothetical protein